MGRKPKPTRLKILNGNPGGRPLNATEPHPRRGIPEPPACLDAFAREVWAELVPELDRLGLLTVVDRWALAAFCTACSDFEDATQTIANETRQTARGTGALMTHPAFTRRRQAMKDIRDFCALFGLDPSSRSRLHVDPPSEEKDEFESFVGG